MTPSGSDLKVKVRNYTHMIKGSKLVNWLKSESACTNATATLNFVQESHYTNVDAVNYHITIKWFFKSIISCLPHTTLPHRNHVRTQNWTYFFQLLLSAMLFKCWLHINVDTTFTSRWRLILPVLGSTLAPGRTRCTVIINKCKKLNSLKHLVRTTVAGSHN